MGWAAFLALVMAAVPGCYTKRPAEPEPETVRVAFEDLEREDWRDVAVDVLVVMDSFGGAGPQQEILARDFGVFLSELLDPQDPDARPVRDMHVGVVSTDLGVGGNNVQTCDDDPFVGDDGILQHEPQGESCDSAYPLFLAYDLDVDRLARDFGCIARLGTDGCSFEQQLEASYRGLMVQAQPGGANEDFLREDSILTLLIVTERYDCSAQDTSLFDISSLPYSIGMQCIYGSDKLFPVSRYADMLRSIRDSDSKIALGVIAGVPPDESMCNGRGDALEGCLDLYDMQLEPRLDAELPRYACTYPPACSPPDPPSVGDCTVTPYPAPRIVELAQMMGPSALVSSICTDSYAPALLDLASIVRENVLANAENPPPYFVKNPDDPAGCLCKLDCVVMEELAPGRECGEGKIPRDDGSGRVLCEIPQAGSRLVDCSMECRDPAAAFLPAESSGWYFDPNAPEGPVVELNGIVPAEGATLWVECE